MPEVQHSFLMTPGMTLPALAARLLAGAPVALQEERPRRLERTWVDTFDWRAYAAGLALELQAEGGGTRLLVHALEDAGIPASVPLPAPPRFARDLPAGHVRDLLGPILSVRALLPLVTVSTRVLALRAENEVGKTVLRIELEENRVRSESGRRVLARPNRVVVKPVRGYRAPAGELMGYLAEHLHLQATPEVLLLPALAARGRRPLDYSAKLDFRLAAHQRADEAARTILRHLLSTLQANEDGVRRCIDPEFLHDFRVAVRRTRSALAQFKGVFPQRTLDRFREEFRWLGGCTNDARDMDVYLLAFDDYQTALGPAAGPHLEPLREFLGSHRTEAYGAVVQCLGAGRYQRLLESWTAFLGQPLARRPRGPDATRPVGDLARRRIWKVYRQVMKRGRRVDDDTPAADLHALRIACKKLRYLMEFFRSLYPEPAISDLIKALKDFQDNLGEFQDLHVQQEALRRFEATMNASGLLLPTTREAMEALVAHLGAGQGRVRAEFSERFSAFADARVAGQFETLFGPRAGAPEQPP